MKICFWGNVAKALTGKTDGGGELQIALLAKALARGGHEVVLVDYRITEDFVTEDGIKVFGIKGWDDGIRIVRTLTHRLPKIYKSLKAQKADVYYCRIRDFRHLLAYFAARKVKAKFILGLASDLDAMNLQMRLKYLYNLSLNSLWAFSNSLLIELVYPWLLRKADVVFTQHNGQQQILLKKNIKSVVFPNLIDLAQIPLVSNPVQNDFIYVGGLDRRKGFIEFFDLVKKTPQFTYKVIGQPRDRAGHYYYKKISEFKNVKLLGRLNHNDTLLQIANSKALISTSRIEGFPNVFIEAWACGIPVMSLYVDLGTLIKNEGLGEVANGNPEILLHAMAKCRNTKAFAEKAKAYVKNTHDLNDKKVGEISSFFNKIQNS